MASQQAVVIKKVIKKGGHGHHGGAWKVAYADFVTAMMAFFLLMWLINTTSPEQKRGIADYFAPASVSTTTSGAGGILAGTAIADAGARNANGSPPADRVTTEKAVAPEQVSEDPPQPSQDALDRAKALREEAEFDKAEMAIHQAIQDLPDVAELSKHLILDRTPEGLRIQIVDQEGRSMFEPGSSRPTERAVRLLRAVGQAVAQLPNKVSLSGHTDETAANARDSSPWELSSLRANTARKVLEAAGMPMERVRSMAGKADSEPLFPEDPTLPGNRRVSIVLLREAPTLPSDYKL